MQNFSGKLAFSKIIIQFAFRTKIGGELISETSSNFKMFAYG